MFPVIVFTVAMMLALGLLAFLASRSKASYEASNQLIPGTDSGAPSSWAGSHDPEARLHRRLRDSLAALRANQAFDDDGGLLELRVEMEHQVQRIDERLIAVSALPGGVRVVPLQELTEEVDLVELLLVDLASVTSAAARASLEQAVARVRERVDLVEQARSTLDDQQLHIEPRQADEPDGTGSAQQPLTDEGEET